MASQRYEYAISVIREYFGPVVSTVCEALRWGPLSLKLLSNNLSFSTATVKQALSILINFNFVAFKVSEGSSICEYSLLTDNILLILKYPRFLLMIRNKFGKDAEFIINELLYSSRMTLSTLIIRVTCLSKAHLGISYSLNTIKNTVCDLIQSNFIVPIGRVTDDIVPQYIALTEDEKIPTIDMQKLSKLYKGEENDFPKKELYWKINFDRFLVEYRDEIIINAMVKRFDTHSRVVVRHLLKLAYTKTDPWRPVSNPIPMRMIRESIGNDSNKTDAVKLTEPYIRAMEEDSSGIIGRLQEHGGEHSGVYVVCFKDFFENLVVSCVSQVVERKFGSKASRVFRLVQDKKFIEIEEIQKLAMLADKETKQITYKLLEENFLQFQELRRPTTNSNASGSNKSYFIFYVDMNLIVTMVIGMCYKALLNFSSKWDCEHDKHKHIIEKKHQAEVAVRALEEKANEEQINDAVNVFLSLPEKAVLSMLQKVDRKLFLGELQIDETIFILQCYISYNQITEPKSKLKKKK